METDIQIGQLIEKAAHLGVSDIHFMPDGAFYLCYFRRSGQLELEKRLDESAGRRIISYLKFLGNMDVGERRRPQSGSAIWNRNSVSQDLRFSTMTNFRQEESLVIRLLSKTAGVGLEEQSFFQEDIHKLKRLVRYKSGLLLFSGAVGSGKTTTMYQLIRQFAMNEQQQVITVEDPIEVEETSFLQCQVNEKAGIFYETLLKSSLRHHPDILIVGEIRDEETAKMVIRGALTGHLILASVHAKNATGVVERLMELGVSNTLLKQTALGIVYQKLLSRTCARCGDICSVHCRHVPMHNKRAALYDVWTGEKLNRLLNHHTKNKDNSGSNSFNHRLRKAWAYGYISTTTFDTHLIP